MRVRGMIRMGLCAVFFTASLHAGTGTFESGAFEFVVTVDQSISDVDLESIRGVFENASDLLHDLTGGRHVFGDVTVRRCAGSGDPDAEFWVTDAYLTRATNAGYGTSGQHVILNRDQLLTMPVPHVALLHEFCHHAYGLHDEYIGPLPADVVGPWDAHDPPFADDDPAHAWNWHQVVCINAYNDLPAAEQATTSPPLFSCLASLAGGHQPGQPTCVMEHIYCESAYGAGQYTICNDANHEKQIPENPGQTWQQFIQGTSCWSTIDASPYPLPSSYHPSKSAFQWILSFGPRRFALVIDHSGSMTGTKLDLAKQGAKIFLNPLTEEDEVAVVAFDHTATTIAPLLPMTPANRAAAKAAIDAVGVGGGTNFQVALTEALAQLTSAVGPHCTRAIVFLSDGEASKPTAAIQQAQNEKISVCTIGLGTGFTDDSVLEEIATETGGLFFKTLTPDELSKLFAQHSAWLKNQGVLEDSDGVLAAGEKESVTARIDAATKTATFVTSWSKDGDAISVKLKTPSGAVIDGAAGPGGLPAGVDYSKDGASVTYVVGGAAVEIGAWKVIVKNTTTSAIDYNVTGLSDSPHVSFLGQSDKPTYQYPEPMRITAVAADGAPLTGIAVKVAVVRPDGSQAAMILSDDGNPEHGDDAPNDGVYSGLFSAWNQDGAYSVKLLAKSKGGKQRVAPETFGLDLGEEPIVQAIERHAEFAVTVSGTPPVKLHNLLVDKLNVDVGSTVSAENGLDIKGSVDLDMWSVEPAKDTLTIRVGSRAYTFGSADLVKMGSKDRYCFKSLDPQLSGFVDLFNQGSSLGKFRLVDKSIYAGEVGDLSSIECRFAWGAMDETIKIIPKVTKDGTEAVFSKTQSIKTELFFVTSAKVMLQPGGLTMDKLSVRAKIGGKLSLDTAPAVIQVGTFAVTIGPSAWTKNKKDGTYTYLDTIDGRMVSVLLDVERSELCVTGSLLDLAGFTNPTVIALQNGAFDERVEIHLTSKTNGNGKTTLSY